MSAELLHITRGDIVETVVRGHVAVVNARGLLLASCGDPGLVTYMRSAAKPLQATALLRSGASNRFGLTGPLLAICCASHNGESRHVLAVRDVLRRADVPEVALQCGIHAPSYPRAAAEIWASGSEPTALHHNCSGKHAGMLASARALGAPLDDYLARNHPVQQSILGAMAALTHVPRAAIALAIDGCSAPVHGLPLRAMAQAYAYLADPESAPDYGDALAPIGAAMVAHPWFVAGTGRADTRMMERAARRLIVKGGAEGVLCVAVRDAGVGLALKVEGGRNEHAHAAAIHVLRQLGLLTEDEVAALGDIAHPLVHNYQGLTVGQVRPVAIAVASSDR